MHESDYFSIPEGRGSQLERDLDKARSDCAYLEKSIGILKGDVAMLTAERDRLKDEVASLRTQLLRCRMISAHVPAAVYIKAQEDAGFGNQVTPAGS